MVVLCRQGFEAKAQALEASHIQASGAVDRSKISIEAKQRAEDDIRRDVEIAKLGAENALVERVRELVYYPIVAMQYVLANCDIQRLLVCSWLTALRHFTAAAYFARASLHLPKVHSFCGQHASAKLA